MAKEQITNLITPVSYFVNHEQQLKILEKHLDKYRQASIVGTSGIGKTQLIRMYSYENKNNYDLIWLFDCNLDLNEQFVKLAQQLNMVKQTRCLVPGDSGVYYKELPSREELWDKYYTAVPKRQRQYVSQSKIVKRA